MSLMIKICGLTEPVGLAAALEGGADFLGFIFCEKGVSRCYVEPEEAAALLEACPHPVAASFPKIVGVFRNQSNADILRVLDHVALDYLQLHGDETPARVAEIKRVTGKPVIKVFRVAAQEHLAALPDYASVADMYLFDTLTSGPTAGGTGKSFDWNLMRSLRIEKEWLLAGGLNASNLAQAVATSGARIVDVSSGVEKPSAAHERRIKDPEKVRTLLRLAHNL